MNVTSPQIIASFNSCFSTLLCYSYRRVRTITNVKTFLGFGFYWYGGTMVTCYHGPSSGLQKRVIRHLSVGLLKSSWDQWSFVIIILVLDCRILRDRGFKRFRMQKLNKELWIMNTYGLYILFETLITNVQIMVKIALWNSMNIIATPLSEQYNVL